MAFDLNLQARAGLQQLSPGVPGYVGAGMDGSLLVSRGLPDYYELCRGGLIQQAHAIVTAPVIYTTAAGTGGPVLHNRTANKVAVLLKVGIGLSVVTTVAASLGLTGRGDQGDTVMTSTTAIDSQVNMYLGGAVSAMSLYRVATPAAAGAFFMPLADLHTGALTVDNLGMGWFDIEGLVLVPPGAWIALAASATATTAVIQAGFIWAEVPHKI
jgi:hypothetical protein